VIERHFGDGSQFGCDITYLGKDPSNPLGTGGPLGSLSKLFPRLSEPVLVMNGDLVTQFDVAAMLAHHEQTRRLLYRSGFLWPSNCVCCAPPREEIKPDSLTKHPM